MENNDLDTSARIIKATKELLEEYHDIEKITVRKIAERANVGIGLINYHFKTRDKLLITVVGELMSEMAVNLAQAKQSAEVDPINKLKVMLHRLYSMGTQYDRLMQFLIPQLVLNGDMQTSLYIVPVLREIFLEEKNEIELRIMAHQIVLPLQISSINPTAFFMFSGIDLHNESQRNHYINQLIENIV